MSSLRERVFCAFCKNPKYIRNQKHIGWTNVLICFVAAMASGFVLWQSFDPKIVVLFTVYTGISEIFTYLSWRASVRCESCAFDPVLYRSNPAKASHIVKEHLEELRASGNYLLKRNNPFANLPVQTKPAAEMRPKESSDVSEVTVPADEAKSEALLSRQV